MIHAPKSGNVLRTFWTAAVAVLFAGSFHQPTASQGPPPAAQAPEFRTASRRDTSDELRRLPAIPPRPVGVVVRPPRRLPNRIGGRGTPGDGALQQAAPTPSQPIVGASIEGLGNVNGVLPPDTNGDVGPNHYVQMVNLSFAVWNKSGTLLYGPVDADTLWQGLGGPCETSNDGDPIVVYDHLADRWMLSQFALPNFPNGPFYQCIAVSQSPDPLGAYHRYEFKVSDNKLNDYPKFGVWPDGYYMSINQFTCGGGFPFGVTCSWAGQGVVTFERDQMLNGQPARMIYFDLYNLDPNLGGMLPSDLDGPAPAAGTPNSFALVDDDAWGYSPDQLQIWAFHTNWTSPTSSTFSRQHALATAPFDSDLCGYSRNCIPQRDTSVKVDAISDRLMFRLQYRNFGTHQTLVTNHTVDVNGADRAGVRWYELINSGAGWNINQQGTYSPDSDHRWMASAAMNSAGQIALGFSVSSGTLFPSIRATGRLAADSVGQMTQGESTIVAGTGHQTHSSGRWGDYSMMAVDPVDDCTFWYTQQYYGTKSSASWQTRIASFNVADCGAVNNAPTANIATPAEGSTVAGTVAIQISASDTEDAAGALTVEWNVDGGAWQAAPFNSVTGYYEASWDTAAAAEGAHTLNARATDSDGKSASDANGVTVDNVNDAPVASFTHACSGLTCSFDGSGSSDGDGTIASYAWDFGDGTAGSGANVSHSYAVAGTYTVTLTVTDNDGAPGSTSKSVVVALTMHAGDLDGSKTSSGNNWTAVVTITVHDSGHGAVSGATVSGTWSNGASGSATCTTDSTGRCTVRKSGIAKRTSSVRFTVGNVTHGSLTYASSANHDPDGDSNGTSITVTKP